MHARFLGSDGRGRLSRAVATRKTSRRGRKLMRRITPIRTRINNILYLYIRKYVHIIILYAIARAAYIFRVRPPRLYGETGPEIVELRMHYGRVHIALFHLIRFPNDDDDDFSSPSDELATTRAYFVLVIRAYTRRGPTRR